MKHLICLSLLSAAALAVSPRCASASDDLWDRVEHHYADSQGVKIHYVALGEGPLVVMLHGFPDFWYTWRNQMTALAEHYRVVAVDLRGYNRSDQPEGVASYAMPLLVADVVAVIEDAGAKDAIVVGNDWGGAIAWFTAMLQPQRVNRLVICNLPHPNGLSRELSSNKEQQQNSQYARDFQKDGAHEKLTVDQLTRLVAGARGEQVQARYREAFERSSMEGMLNYYKANYPRQAGGTAGSGAAPAAAALPLPKVRCPVLLIHGLKDTALLASGLNDTWEWIDNELTIYTLPDAGHFVQQDAPQRVTRKILGWLALDPESD